MSAERGGKAKAVSRQAVVKRLWRTADRQVGEIEARLVEAGGDPASLERDAKTLATLAKTIRDLVALDGEMNAKGKAAPAHDQRDEPRDFNEFRQRIAAKMAELVADRAGA